MSKLVKCGIMKCALGFSDIMCDQITGDLVLRDDMNGNCLMSNISLKDPITAEDKVLYKLMEQTDSIGAAMSADYIITFKEETCDYRELSNPLEVWKTFEYDTNIVYEDIIEED